MARRAPQRTWLESESSSETSRGRSSTSPAVASAETELNIIPHGQQELGVPWAKTAGILPANAQALMYDRLTPLGRNVTDATLAPSFDGTGYFKSAKLLSPDDPSLITDQTITAE